MNPPPTWPEWFLIAIPMCIVIDLAIWALLLLIYRPGEHASPPELYSNQHNKEREFNATQIYVLLVTFITIILWCAAGALEQYIGDMGVIAIIPIVCFYGAGVLTKDGFQDF